LISLARLRVNALLTEGISHFHLILNRGVIFLFSQGLINIQEAGEGIYIKGHIILRGKKQW